MSELLERSGFFALPPRRLSGLPDVIQYRLEVDDAGRQHQITFDGESCGEELLLLIEQIEKLA
ncbi:MAG: hypothetical protein A2W00_02685 [Candidatus Eisenbacteria bacterium RBG_16_71_46]|nr:MAG: hypothetical protein A2W00_02685 [Candidatus Eisenbacteria bacterium RBG_16_71_46]OGF22406.1 MAG: hypothetical protein A2V63_10075 [Candidatus Eisenbacteria bacterium RBG_19FT_COMBO_70_11]